MGDKIWEFVPWAWSGRIGVIPMYNFEGFSQFKSVNKNFLQNSFAEVVNKGIPIAVVSFLIICIIGVIWFKKWEGIKSN